MAWRIRVTFAGNLPPKEYTTPDIRHNDPGWASEVFNRPIEALEFFLPTGDRIVMAGMEKYNFFIEAVQSKKTRGKAAIQAFWFCGKPPATAAVDMWRVGFGSVIIKRMPWGSEWGGGPTRGWKTGAPGTPVSTLVPG